VQTFAILDHCEIRQEDADMESLTKKLVRCYEIAQRFQAEFVNEMETYRRQPKQNPMMIEIPHIMRLEEECHNFLYEAKNGKPHQSPSVRNRKIGSDCSFQASEPFENCSFSDRDGARITSSLISFLLLFPCFHGQLDLFTTEIAT
jgi:hypothetical protein